MKKQINLICSIALLSVIISCNDEESFDVPQRAPERTGIDLSQFNSETSNGIMMQSFYWDVEPIGDWYNLINSKVADWAESGVNRIWLPPVSKGQSGMFSMGYDPSDYFDVGEFEQHGTVETRFGSRAELETLIDNAHNNNLEVIADIVMSHNSGGGREDHPLREGDNEVFTLFNEENGNASGKFNRDYRHFHPNEIQLEDGFGVNPFFEKTDLSHEVPYVREWLWERDDSFAKFLKNDLGFDGWRFDFVKSFDPKWVKAWNDEVGGFSIGENFDGNAEVLRDWVAQSESPAFDFACFFKLDEALDRNRDLTILAEGDMLRKTDPLNAVTFVSNHDTDGRREVGPNGFVSLSHKMLAYAYILTHDGYPTVFYSDYENTTFNPMMKRLMQVHNTIASGEVTIVEASKNIYIMRREGSETNPGLILAMNIGRQSAAVNVATNWNNKRLFDYTRNSEVEPTTNALGETTLRIPPNNFGVWSIAE